AGNTPDDDAISWPSLTNVGPNVMNAPTTPSDAVSATEYRLPRRRFHGHCASAQATDAARTTATTTARRSSAAPRRLSGGTSTTSSSGGGPPANGPTGPEGPDRKSTRLNSSHVSISYAVFCS